jgi:hypothetical protein
VPLWPSRKLRRERQVKWRLRISVASQLTSINVAGRQRGAAATQGHALDTLCGLARVARRQSAESPRPRWSAVSAGRRVSSDETHLRTQNRLAKDTGGCV